MLFNSISFIFFLLIVFCVYWSIPSKYQWILLLLSSYYFYMSWNAKYVVLILFTTLISYITARLIESVDVKKKRIVLTGGVLVCLFVLLFFKYFNFLAQTTSDILGVFSIKLNPITLKVLIPVGISFYTFQTISYMIDVYRGKTKAEHHFGIYATFISFFPQLVAGPIERTEKLLPQIKKEQHFNYDTSIYGLRLMLWGFFKKIVVADVLAQYVDLVYANVRNHTGLELVICILFFTFQIYCDFSGYSDIAIGTAKLLGVELTTNFKSPYYATSIKDFWNRWHISLSTWLRDYVYIPLGGSYCTKARHRLNIIITFLISGLWHGANGTFVLWGGIHGILQVIEDFTSKPLQQIRQTKIGRVALGIIVFILCNLAWVFFRANTIDDAIYVIIHCLDGITDISKYLYNDIGLNRFILLRIMLSICAVMLFDYLALKNDVLTCFSKFSKKIRVLVEYSFIGIILFTLINSLGTNQFVYFQF